MTRAAAIACAAAALAGSFAVGFFLFRDGSPTPTAATLPVFHHGPIFGYGPVVPPPPPEKPPLALEQVRLALAQAYYRHVSPSWLVEPTIEEILERLDDPYTEYLTPEQHEALQDELERRYYGVGLTVHRDKHGLVVTRSLAGPAREAGIRPGDLIVSIDGRPATGLQYDQSTALIRGEEGTVVRLAVRRRGKPKVLTFEVERGPVSAPPVSSRLVKAGDVPIGYIRLLAFTDDASVRVGDAARQLIEQGAEGFVLDLRGDPGGYLAQAVRVASLFLESGVVCSTSGVNQGTREYTVSGAAVDTERPMVVLVDRQTASASEIVAAALRDNGRAVIVGRKTYGKATIQSVIALSNGGALKLTTATYLTPNGASIGGRGLKPKVKASDDPFTRVDEALVAAKETLLAQLA